MTKTKLTKDPSLLKLLDQLRKVYGEKNILIQDHWDADLQAIGLTNSLKNALIYISLLTDDSFSIIDGLFYLSVEDTEDSTKTHGTFDKIGLEEVLEKIETYLIKPRITKKEPKFRCGGNWDELAELFNYEIRKDDQDWTYTIAESHRLDEYLAAYNTLIMDEDTKFSLMEMIIEALHDLETLELKIDSWPKVKTTLKSEFDLHKYTIWYWALWDTDDPKNRWDIAYLFRSLWIESQESIE